MPTTDKPIWNTGLINNGKLEQGYELAVVRHGHWIWMGEQGDSRYMCSVCNCKEDNVPTCNGEPTIWEYCPNCGAKMDEVEDAKTN